MSRRELMGHNSVVGKYVIAPTPSPKGGVAYGVWDGHHVVHHGTRAECAAWAKVNQEVKAPGVEWTWTE